MNINHQLRSVLLGTALCLLSAVSALAQRAVTATGVVTDESGAALPGVVVIVKGETGNGTVTDNRGAFELKATSGAILQFSCLGYADAEAAAGPNLHIVLSESMQELDDVIVIGYGTAKKSDVTGGLSVVSDKELKMVSTPNLMDRLVGQIAGLSITTESEAPGSNQSLLIRGQNSISATNTPLVVLDGIPYEGSLADLDPNLIDNMTVLKDASSVAIYGSRGSNGVILIQTKKGTKGTVKVTYKGQYSIAEPMQRIQTMGPNEFIRLKQDLARLGTKQYSGEQLDPLAGDVISVSEKQNYAAGITHDWQDYVFRTVFNHDHQLSISGGNDRTTYMAAVSFLDGDGVVYNSNYQRTSVYSNVIQNLNDWLRVGLTTQFVNKESGGVTPNLEHAIKQSPYGLYIDETGQYVEEPMEYSNLPNPMKDVNADQKATTRNFLANGFVDVTLPLPGLTFRSQLGYNYRNSLTGTYYGRDTSTGRKVNGQASIANSHTTDATWENVLRYDQNFGKHHIDLTGLFSMQQKENTSSSQTGQGFVNDDSSFYKMDGAEGKMTMSSGYWKETMVSYMLRANYGFAGRYYLTLTGRADGASVFGRNNKYGFFPSAALAWNLGEESFIKDNTTAVDLLKVRLSYGANGNNAISRYQTLDRLYATNGVKYIWGDEGIGVNAAYLGSDGVGNPDLKWETTYTANLGIDFSVLRGRIGGSVDIYWSRTKDLLMTRTVPIMNGYSKIWDNVGETENKGIELTLNTKNIQTRDFGWSTDLSFFLNRDKIVELRGDGLDDVSNKWFIGKPLSVYYDYYMVGLWQSGDEFTFIDEDGKEVAHQTGAAPGSAKLEDVDGNGIINADDRKVIGSTRPSFTLSMSNRLSWKDFYFSFLVNGVFAKWMQDNVANLSSWTFGSGNYIKGANYWTPEHPDADIVSPGYINTFSHGYYKKLTYVNIKNITLGYTVPQVVAQRLHVAGIDVNVSVNNPTTFSNMRQMLNYDNTWFASYPTARSYMLGVTLNF
ncbi:MAG: TonB-dependent receptor [Bacteroidales bacterium]|nr:TonB-dependent receptor [Bacteroidales bacterium]